MKNLQHNSIISNKELKATFDEKKRQMTHIVSTEDVNVYGYILKNSGMNQDEYRNNPVVLWAHEISGGYFDKSPAPSELIVGKNIVLNVTTKGIEAVTEFADTDLGNEVMQLNMGGFLNAWSVRWDWINDPEQDMMLVNEVPVVLNWKVKEYSSCVLPGNPFATNQLQQALSVARTPMMKNYLNNHLETAKIIETFEQHKTDIDKKLAELTSPQISKADIENLKNELKADYGRFKKETTEKIFKLAYDNLQLKLNLHSEILTSINKGLNARIDNVIRGYLGKVPNK